MVPGSDVFPAQRFSGVGKSIHEIRKEGEQLHEQGIDGQYHIAVCGSRGGEKDGYGNQAERTEEDVPVHLEKTFHFTPVEQSFLVQVLPQRTIVGQPEQAGHSQSRILCHEGTEGHSFHFHAEGEDEKQAGGNVDDVLGEGDEHRETGVLHADVPAGKAVESQRGRSSPDADMEIQRSQLLHLFTGVHEGESQTVNRNLKYQQGKGQQQTDAQRAE